jgi:hypothetical protein
MSTIEAAGIRLDLVGPRPEAPPFSLLETPGVVQERDNRVFNGVNLIGFPDDTPSLWEPCQDGTFDVKGEGTARPEAAFDPFAVYLPVTCSTFGQAEIAEQARAVAEATASMAVEEYLAAGGPSQSAPNPYFGDGDVDLPAGATAQSPGVALSYLEEAIGLSGRKGMIHATPAVVAALQAIPVGGEAGPLITANGTPVISGTGYQGVDTAALATPGTTEDWIFATGPVEVYLGPIQIQDLFSALDRSINEVTFRAERYVLAVWDTVVQSAVLVDWST